LSTYNFEFAEEEKLRVGYLGCGGHSYRNVYPCFQYAPIDLMAVCDLNEGRARHYARQFGARRHFTDYQEMLSECELDAVFVVTGYDRESGRVTHPPHVIAALEAGCHVWSEKPPASSVAEVEEIQQAEQSSGKFAFVGFKKIFSPAIAKAREIAHSEEFGGVSSIYCRYPQRMPVAIEERGDTGKMQRFLDHIVHPASILRFIGGPMRTLSFKLDPLGGSVSTIGFESGTVGVLHAPGGQSGTSPYERLEVVGEGANVVVDNGVRLTYYRPGTRGAGGYGTGGSFIGEDEAAPMFWEPEFSLATLYNKNLFYEGFVFEIRYFCECVREGRRPEIGGTDFARDVMALYEAYGGEEERVVELG
jgi:predicted dehydrogenase